MLLRIQLSQSLIFRTLLFVFLSGLYSLPAHSQILGVFLEPMLTYQKGDATTNWNPPLEKSTSSVTGSGLGLRLGYHFLDTLFLAADARYSHPEWKNSNLDLASKATDLNYGLTLGFQPPIIGLRVWGTYVFDGSLDPMETQGFDFKFRKAQGYRLGGGFSFILVSLNLEYQELKHTDLEIERTGSFTGISASNTAMDSKTWIASVSIPFSF